LNAKECGLKQNRLRHFQFGSCNGVELWIERERAAESQIEKCCMASEGKKGNRRSFADFCELQGLPRNFNLPMLSIRQNYKVVGNGVAVPMARMIAKSIRRQITTANHKISPDKHTLERDAPAKNNPRAVTLCKCGCGRPVTGRQKAANAACRKRLERKRKSGTNHTYL
jgi:DNA (cytosine-5)-methyltransferase 1